ncbi:F-box/LRR-repeat protein 6-like [Oppia nitens]|uniref:F-box/LRR-repeat protein 6-like n=1 Tax=Oppia nitens TaxID=1686743 RepID=UPI0023DBD59F|nr:F-box/LRR-repeat protein 6-like [Oppia nitens]
MMNIINQTSVKEDNHNQSKSTHHQKVLFDYQSKQLWPEEDSEEDMDYVPNDELTSDQSLASPIRDDSMQTNSGSSNRTDLLNQSVLANNGVSGDRVIPTIKILKNKRKNSKKWSIVGDTVPTDCQSNGNKDNGANDNTNGAVLAPKKRGRKPGTKFVNGYGGRPTSSADKSNKKRKNMSNDRKQLEKDYKHKCIVDESENKSKKLVTNWRFTCLLKEVDHDFEQKLPKEILIRIFDYVLVDDKNRTQSMINLSQVCESWRNLITTTPLLWKSLDLQTFSEVDFAYNDLFAILNENELFDHLKALNLSSWNGSNAERVLDEIAVRCADRLNELTLKNCKNISSQFLTTLSTYCPNIIILDISAITAASHQNSQSPFATTVFRPYLEKCGNNLISLNISENTMPSFHGCITSIMDFCPNLQLLDISNVESLTKTASIPVEKIQTSCPNLRIFRAANIAFTVSTSGSQTDGFKALEELSIPSKSDFSTAIMQNAHTDNVLEQLTKNAENLKLLDIRGARYLSHRALVKIPAWNIQHLSISNCPKLNTDQLEMVFTKWNRSLIDVDLSWNTSEDSVTSCIKLLCEVGKEESQLRTLQLRGSAVSYECIKILFKSCPKLESLDLQSCRGLPRGIKRSYSGEELILLKNEVLEGKYD